eukprot:scaffold6230_cov151-Skeletonema_menzelii.AAC.14
MRRILLILSLPTQAFRKCKGTVIEVIIMKTSLSMSQSCCGCLLAIEEGEQVKDSVVQQAVDKGYQI